MHTATIRHTIVMLVYNQQEYINSSLDSIFNQEVIPYEVIIGDDCSSDDTLLVVKKYADAYPDIVKVFAHNKNLGIIDNFNFLLNHITGDIVTFFAGDDLLKPGLFTELNRVIKVDKIDLESDFVIVTNTSMLYPSGTEVIWDNFKFKQLDAFKQRIRYSINYRSVGISTSVIKKAGPLKPELGYHSDWIWSLSIDLIASKHYYTSFISSVYRIGSGVTLSSKDNELLISKKHALLYLKVNYCKFLDSSDLLYLSLENAFIEYQISSNFSNYINMISLVIKNVLNVTKNNHLVSIRSLIPIEFMKILVKVKQYIFA